MKQKYIVGAVGVLLAGMAVFSAYWMLRSSELLPENNLWNGGSQLPQPPSGTLSAPAGDLAAQYNIPNFDGLMQSERDLFSQKPGKTVHPHEAAEYRGVLYTVNDFSISKQTSLTSDQRRVASGVEADETGTIRNAYNYFTVSLTLENISDTTQEVYLNSQWIYFTDTENNLRNGGGEVIGYDGKEARTKDFYQQFLEPGEKRTFQVSYYVSDEILKDLKLATLVVQPGDYPNAIFLDMLME